MAIALPSRRAPMDQTEAARLHFVLRFSVGTTIAFIVCEWMGWQPAALAPVLTGVLLANLPFSPPLKVGIGLTLIMATWAWLAFFLTTLFSHTPHILFGLIGLILLVTFATLAKARGQLPLTLLLICFAVLPVAILTVPQIGPRLPSIFARAMLLAVVFTWVAYAIWPLPSPKSADPPAAPAERPLAAALVATSIVMPVMLVYWLFGLTDAIPVLLTTILLVAKIEEDRGAATGVAKLVGNFIGGFIAIAGYYLLFIAPSLVTLAFITFFIGAGFAMQIVKGGVRGGNALLAYNGTMVIFGLAILKDQGNSGVWGVRVFQFMIAYLFAVGMMRLLMPLANPRPAPLLSPPPQ